MASGLDVDHLACIHLRTHITLALSHDGEAHQHIHSGDGPGHGLQAPGLPRNTTLQGLKQFLCQRGNALLSPENALFVHF